MSVLQNMNCPPLLRTACGIWLLIAVSAGAALAGEDERSQFAREVAERHDIDKALIREALDAAEHDPRVLERIASPAEALTWAEYRPIFLTESRVEAAVEYADRNATILEAVEDRYGVPAEVLLAILGVESYYGTRAGDHRVLDALTTLGFSDHPRAGFFRNELESFLVIAAENNWNPADLKGSYAGAFGKPQFIPSSYRAYAVDFSGDGRRDLVNSPEDALASAAHYLAEHGWQEGGPIALRVSGSGDAWQELLANTGRPVAPRDSVGKLREHGIELPSPLSDEQPATLIQLDGAAGNELWATFENFYALTRYNHSALYAMAVHQLAAEIAEELGE